jgi:hypothetical protein
MMPSAHQQQQQLTSIKQTMKPKIGFSIESIVGGRSSDSFCEDSDDVSSKSPRLPTSATKSNNNNINNKFNDDYSPLIKRARCVSPSSLRNENSFEYDRMRVSRESSVDQDHQNNNNNSDNSSKMLRSRSPSPQQQQQHAATQKTPIIVPALIRPAVPHMAQHYSELSAHNPHLLAQFQAAAALANVQAAQQSFNGHLPPHQHLPPHLHNPNLPRESYQLYPWLLSRHGRIFPHRFPGSEYKNTYKKC